jgi:hypothetical protein
MVKKFSKLKTYKTFLVTAILLLTLSIGIFFVSNVPHANASFFTFTDSYDSINTGNLNRNSAEYNHTVSAGIRSVCFDLSNSRFITSTMHGNLHLSISQSDNSAANLYQIVFVNDTNPAYGTYGGVNVYYQSSLISNPGIHYVPLSSSVKLLNITISPTEIAFYADNVKYNNCSNPWGTYFSVIWYAVCQIDSNSIAQGTLNTIIETVTANNSSPTPTITASPTLSPTPTPTPSPMPTPTATPTPSPFPSSSPNIIQIPQNMTLQDIQKWLNDLGTRNPDLAKLLQDSINQWKATH